MQRLPRVLVVGMADSIHLARWLKLFSDEPMEIVLLPSSPSRRIHPWIKELAEQKSQIPLQLHLPKVTKYLGLPLWLLDKLLGNRLRGKVIAKWVKKFDPDFLHALELQNAGYIVNRFYKTNHASSKPPLFITNYGSEIVWYQGIEKHKRQLEKLLANASYFSAECERDVRLAKSLGFSGLVMPTVPVSGGLDNNQIFKADSGDDRNLIVVKGYENKWGQARFALEAIELLGAELSEYQIAIYSENFKLRKHVRRVRKNTNLDIIEFRKHTLRHSEILDLFRSAMAYIGLSKSDGISTSMLEAMSQGAIPIQSSSSCANEWIKDGKDGFLVEYNDVTTIVSALRKIIRDNSFVKNARSANEETIRTRYDSSFLSIKAKNFYRQILIEAK